VKLPDTVLLTVASLKI